jgi:hypothetical protein
MTILLTDYGGTTPSAACKAIAEAVPDLPVGLPPGSGMALTVRRNVR